MYEADTVLIAMYGATIGKTAIVENEVFMVWSPLAIIKNNPQYCPISIVISVIIILRHQKEGV